MKIESEAVKVNLIGGRLCLDFTNTVGGRIESIIIKERLENYTDLVAWSRYAGLLTDKEARHLLSLAGKRAAQAEAVLRRAATLREAIYRIFESVLNGSQPDRKDLDRLNRELAEAKEHEWLVHTRDGFIWEWKESGNALDYMLWVVSRSAAELLTSEDLGRVHRCGGESCGWLFLDISRNRSRQWCDMKVCGNLAKVRRFRQRER